MSRRSRLTHGLEPLGVNSKAIRCKLNELYALDKELQVTHAQAKNNDELGEQVVTQYKTFLSCRQQLIAELEQQQIQVPWQLRMTIDELELTLRQRRRDGKSSLPKRNDLSFKETQEPGENKLSGPVAVTVVVPTLVTLLIAMLWYHFNA